ncbi:insulin-2-like [Spea bombifrons]|uniref:insulin-2-like n=1 Tax=Spea bombifrons TaxID=233779 RepID=UPI00234B52F5|nr:insulin-2-like [Spea bombifrons]
MAPGAWVRVVSLLALLSYLTETQGGAVQQLCGLHLVEALILVCEGRGFYNKPIKGPDAVGKHNGAKNKVGIVEKCCHQACSYHQLQQYCN